MRRMKYIIYLLLFLFIFSILLISCDAITSQNIDLNFSKNNDIVNYKQGFDKKINNYRKSKDLENEDKKTTIEGNINPN